MKDVVTSQGIKIERIERRGINGDVTAFTPKQSSPPKKRERKHVSVLPQNVFKLDVDKVEGSPLKRKQRHLPVIKKR